MPIALDNSKVYESKSKSRSAYVCREDLEKKLQRPFRTNNREYCIVCGPRGAGKSDIVEHCAIGLDGVIKLSISSPNMKVEVVDQLVYQVLGVTNTEDIEVYELTEALEQCSHRPTIIFDVGCSSKDGVNIATRWCCISQTTAGVSLSYQRPMLFLSLVETAISRTTCI